MMMAAQHQQHHQNMRQLGTQTLGRPHTSPPQHGGGAGGGGNNKHGEYYSIRLLAYYLLTTENTKITYAKQNQVAFEV